ncbi:hypothetical protein ACRYCC_09375 [Actinomadura scrupuli]|uniref:hypothetical protein n=1 Tax=Actinomadura scrupuli TaxID=559629 RepID=UPI003D97EA48
MSGYGGPPSGWRDPYDPYGSHDPYGPPQPPQGWQDPYGYGPPGVPSTGASNGSALGALIANIVLSMTCCGLLAIPGVVMSAIAMGRVNSDPESARSLTLWSWVIFVINIVIVVVAVIVYVALYARSGTDY